MKEFTSVLFFLFLNSGILLAQNEIDRERHSLMGITELGVVINIEKPADLESALLVPSRIRNEVVSLLNETPLRILDDKILKQSDQFPILHIHINVMRASNNTFPFSIELNFYQPVKLVLNRDLQTMASTWNKGQIGVVSPDRIDLIAAEAVYISRLFKEEFRQVN